MRIKFQALLSGLRVRSMRRFSTSSSGFDERQERSRPSAYCFKSAFEKATITVTPTPHGQHIHVGSDGAIAVPSAEQTAAPHQPDILSGLSESDRETALKAIQVLREGPEAFKGLILGGVQAWETLKNDQQGQGVRAVGEKASRAKAR